MKSYRTLLCGTALCLLSTFAPARADYSQNFDTGGVFASILIIGLIGVGLMRLGLKIENHFARWRN